MLTVLVIGILLPFTLLKDENGETMLSISDLKLPGFSLPGISMPDFSGKSDGQNPVPQAEGLGGKDIFYKWYDAEGNVQFTTEKPPAGIEYTVKGFDPNTNVIQAVKIEAKAGEQGSEPEPQDDAAEVNETGDPYSREQIEKLFENAEGLEKLLSDRMQKQNSAIGQ